MEWDSGGTPSAVGSVWVVETTGGREFWTTGIPKTSTIGALEVGSTDALELFSFGISSGDRPGVSCVGKVELGLDNFRRLGETGESMGDSIGPSSEVVFDTPVSASKISGATLDSVD